LAFVRPCHADAQSASLRENLPQRHLRPFPERPCQIGSAPPGRGGLRTPASKASRQPSYCFLSATRLSPPNPVGMECLGIRGASQCGRTECVPPRKPPLTPSPGLAPGGHLSSDGRLRGGAGSARPQGMAWLPPGDRPTTLSGQFARPLYDYDMPRLPYGLAMRTRRPRPSEKIALRAIPRSCPARPSPSLGPRGGAGSARPQGRLGFHRGIAPLGHQAFICPR
jgi:hypothetical protein